LDVTLYEFLLFAHLTFVAVWVGGDLMAQAFSAGQDGLRHGREAGPVAPKISLQA
jgi:hypothetical protein